MLVDVKLTCPSLPYGGGPVSPGVRGTSLFRYSRARSPSIFSHVCQRVAGNGVGAFSNTVKYTSDNPQGEGTGLGLSISHGIVVNNGGRLWFESVEGMYTKAVIDLPVNGSQPS